MIDSVQTLVADRVLTILLNRPQVRNAVDQAVATGIATAIEELELRDDLAVGVLTGAGGTFCSGMDLKAFARGERSHANGRGFAGLVESPPRKPLIAAVEGYAVGGGFEIALACDLIVAGEDSVFGLPEVKRGLIAGAGGLLRLPERVPYHHAVEMVLTGQPVTASRAYELGLVNRVVPTGRALPVAVEIAEEIAGNAPLAVRASKQILMESRDWPQAEQFRRQEVIAEPVVASGDAREGARAFADKRQPLWTGR